MSFARELTSVPQMDTGAPIPLVLASKDRVLLSYLLAEKCASQQCAVVSFEGVRLTRLDFPEMKRSLVIPSGAKELRSTLHLRSPIPIG